MKKLKILLSIMLAALLLVFTSGCYMIKAQRMWKVKGTYELTSYSVTNGQTDKTTDYIATYGYKVYLIVTGDSQGYCVFSSNEKDPYYYPCTLTYHYNQEKTYLVEYVEYSYKGTSQKFGVTSGGLNFSRPVVKIGSLASNGLSVSWKRVDNDTDLSYAEKQLGSIPLYQESTSSEES
jgi:hypothetical protein